MNQPKAQTDTKRAQLIRLLLERHRRHFPTLKEHAFFNYGAQGLLPRPAVEAMVEQYERLLRDGPFTTAALVAVVEELKQTRKAIAAEIGVSSEQIALSANTSMACDTVLWGLSWREGDRILLSDREYPGVIAAIESLQRRFGLTVETFPTDFDDETLLERFVDNLTPRTRLVVLSHVLWNTGRILPLEAMVSAARQLAGEKIRFLIDGAQSAGVLPLELNRIGADYYGFTVHKWLCGPEGLGVLHVRPEAMADLTPTFIGPRSMIYDPKAGLHGLHPDARRFEVSTTAVPLHAGLRAALSLHAQWAGLGDRLARIRRQSRRLWMGLRKLESPRIHVLQSREPETGLVFFRVARTPQKDVVRFLESRQVLLRAIAPGNSADGEECLRASVHYLTTAEEIQRLLEALTIFCREK